MNNTFLVTSLLVFLFLISTQSAAQSVFINELVSSNSAYFDEYGSTPDWFELRNMSNDEIDLTNWTVTDDLNIPDRWVFPNLSLTGNSYLKIWASGKDRPRIGTPRTLIQIEDQFKYIVPTATTSNNWRNNSFDDSDWLSGSAGFGYGDSDDENIVPNGTRSIFVRKSFSIVDPATVESLILDIDYDDGFVAYLNGIEIARANITGDFPAHDAFSVTDREAQIYQGGLPERFQVTAVNDLLQAGENVLSIQVHNASAFSSDLSLLPWLTVVFNTSSSQGAPPPAWMNISSYCLHTNFKISATGETLYLFDNQANFIDSLSSGVLPADVARGRLLNQPSEIRLFTTTTPAAANPNSGLLGALTSDIIFSTPGGAIPNGIMLSLSGVPFPAEIRYTLDATPPTASSALYASPISIDNNTVVRAAIFRENYLPSPVQTETYLFDIEHDLPIVSLVTAPDNLFDDETGIYVLGDDYNEGFPYFGANFWEDWERPIHFSFYEPDETFGIAFNAGVKIFGGWSRAQEQRSLSIFARGQYGTSEIDYPLFPHLSYNNFQAVVLRNAGNDWLRSNFRDIVQTGLLKGADIETQAYRPCATYINGEYWGMYNLREKVNEHYLGSRHQLPPDELDILEANAAVIHGSNEDYLALLQFAEDNDLSNDSDFAQVAAAVDINNYILYQLSQIYFDNTDWPGNNIKYWRPVEGKWRWILFDTDFGFGTWNYFSYLNNTLEHALANDGPNWPNPPWSTMLFRQMMDNTAFQHQFINRFADEMNTRFLPLGVNEHIDTLQAVIANEMPQHFQRWGGDLSTWQNQVNTMKNFADNRQPVVKQHILERFGLPTYHQLQLVNQTPMQGWVQLNSLRIEESNWAGDYFENVPISLTAVPRPGFTFSHWTGAVSSTATQITVNVNSPMQIEAVFMASNFSEIVINEINYNSGEENPAGDWIELYNPNNASIDLSNWIIKDDDDEHAFVFPEGTIIAEDGYLVIVRDMESFTTYYPTVTNILGELNYGLGSNGDAVRLYDPTENLRDIVVYLPTAPWPEAANGQGPTLELIEPALDNSLPQNWANIHPLGSPGSINNESTNSYDINEISELGHYPNPSKGMLTIDFDLTTAQRLQIKLYDSKGRLIRRLFEGRLREGVQQFRYNLSTLPSGNYTIEISPAKGIAFNRQWIKI